MPTATYSVGEWHIPSRHSASRCSILRENHHHSTFRTRVHPPAAPPPQPPAFILPHLHRRGLSCVILWSGSGSLDLETRIFSFLRKKKNHHHPCSLSGKTPAEREMSVVGRLVSRSSSTLVWPLRALSVSAISQPRSRWNSAAPLCLSSSSAPAAASAAHRRAAAPSAAPSAPPLAAHQGLRFFFATPAAAQRAEAREEATEEPPEDEEGLDEVSPGTLFHHPPLPLSLTALRPPRPSSFRKKARDCTAYPSHLTARSRRCISSLWNDA